MFSGLRLRLTLLYLLAALALLTLVGAGAYQLVNTYFQTTTDLALQHRMADEFRRYSLVVPPDLAAADRDWYASRARPVPATLTPPTAQDEGAGHDNEGPASALPPGGAGSGDEESLDGELAAIVRLPLDATGRLLANPASARPPLAPDAQAAAAAQAQGSDWRTVHRADGPRLRLLTYRLPANSGPAALQLGRALDDQDRVLNQLLLGLLGLGAASAVVLSIGSWALAGRALRPAQEAWERQQAFVANASHELRTPLTLLRASAEVARRGLPPMDTDQRALLDDVVHEADHMSRLVEDLLLLSRLDAGRVVVVRQAIALPALFADVQRQVGRLAAERGVQVAVAETGETAWGDPTRLRQVLLILLDNAVRHTPAGGRISLAAQPQGRTVQISVADTGSGIAPDHLPHVFERFYQARGAPSSEPGGAGLGLAIARGLIEAQQGRIAIESRPGAGTRVVLTLLAPGKER